MFARMVPPEPQAESRAGEDTTAGGGTPRAAADVAAESGGETADWLGGDEDAEASSGAAAEAAAAAKKAALLQQKVNTDFQTKSLCVCSADQRVCVSPTMGACSDCCTLAHFQNKARSLRTLISGLLAARSR